MLRKSAISLVLAAALLLVAGCRHAKVQNPIANLDSKQPDKVLYDRAMDAMKHGKYTVARTLLETLINTYPDSEYVARAKLSVGDSWYAEGGTAALAQAEAQYKDFETFFPNLPEAAEAQLKVANIHYRQMEKPDRDFNQAERAEEEYKALIQQFPDSKLVPQAKQRLRDVQEVLAERQFRIARFYFLRDNIAATEARLTSLVSSYPLYSNVDEALFMLGNMYEKQARLIGLQKSVPAATKERLGAEYKQRAVDAYSKIVTRYPMMERADDAKKRLAALGVPVPKATPEAIAQNKAEEASRSDIGRFHSMMDNFHKRPDMARVAKVGEPNMEPEVIASAPALVQELNQQLAIGAVQANPANQPQNQANQAAQGGQTTDQKIGVESVKVGTGAVPATNEAAPGSQPNGSPAATPPPRPNDLQPSSTSSDQAQSDSQATSENQQAAGTQQQGTNNQQNAGSQQNSNGQQNSDGQQDSSSKKKGKKGLRKLIPF